MDDRMFGAKLGKPIPTWDLEHRLPISAWAGPNVRDGATTFRLNSVFLDVTDQSHMIRQWYAGGILVAVLAVIAFGWALVAVLSINADRNWPQGHIVSLSIPLISFFGFGWFAIYFGRQEFFSRTSYPIRFNRNSKKVYALVRSFGEKKIRNNGDCIEEIDWSENSIFCIHRASQDGYHYWIRYYRTDAEGNVEKAVTIGRDWEGDEGLEELLAQWNYWCWFMNRGPAELPKPGLFLPEKESMHESFLYCVYQLGFNASPAFRIMFLPVFLLLASHRVMSLWTCSPPQWPVAILEKCKIDPDDPFDEPKGSTPVGWHATGLAREQGTYPELQSKKIDDWKGEPDGHKNALLWAEDELGPNIRSARTYKSKIS
jgi:hypothetical protein